MYKIIPLLSILLFFITSSSSFNEKDDVAKAEIQSCGGCALNRLSQVKAFIYEDIPKYETVNFKTIHGADPELVLFNKMNEEIKRIPLKDKSREECNKLMNEWGFNMDTKPTQEL